MTHRLTAFATYLASALLLILMVAMFFDTIARNIFNSPIKGGGELVGILQVGMIFVGLALVAVRDEHICVDIFDSVIGPRLRIVQHALSCLLGAGVFGVLSYESVILGGRSFSYGDNTGALKFPVGILLWFIAAMSALTALIFLIKMFVKNGSNQYSIDNLNEV